MTGCHSSLFFLRIDHVQLPGELDLKNLDGRSALGRPLFWLIPMISNSCVARANLDGRSALGRPFNEALPVSKLQDKTTTKMYCTVSLSLSCLSYLHSWPLWTIACSGRS